MIDIFDLDTTVTEVSLPEAVAWSAWWGAAARAAGAAAEAARAVAEAARAVAEAVAWAEAADRIIDGILTVLEKQVTP
jgi:hypothetical protein